MARLSDFDECECGDYRKDHKDGRGACKFNECGRNGGMTHGFEKCMEFRFARAADKDDPNYLGAAEAQQK